MRLDAIKCFESFSREDCERDCLLKRCSRCTGYRVQDCRCPGKKKEQEKMGCIGPSNLFQHSKSYYVTLDVHSLPSTCFSRKNRPWMLIYHPRLSLTSPAPLRDFQEAASSFCCISRTTVVDT